MVEAKPDELEQEFIDELMDEIWVGLDLLLQRHAAFDEWVRENPGLDKGA